MSGEEKKNGAAVTVELSKPIIAHGASTKELHFREPTVADLEAIGNPVSFDYTGDIVTPKFNDARMVQMMSALATVPPSTIKQMPVSEYLAACYRLWHFFMPAGQPTTTPSSSTVTGSQNTTPETPTNS